jgi:hypothetical protein
MLTGISTILIILIDETMTALLSAGRGTAANYRRGADIDLAVDQLVGPVYYRVLITGKPARLGSSLRIVD